MRAKGKSPPDPDVKAQTQVVQGPWGTEERQSQANPTPTRPPPRATAYALRPGRSQVSPQHFFLPSSIACAETAAGPGSLRGPLPAGGRAGGRQAQRSLGQAPGTAEERARSPTADTEAAAARTLAEVAWPAPSGIKAKEAGGDGRGRRGGRVGAGIRRQGGTGVWERRGRRPGGGDGVELGMETKCVEGVARGARGHGKWWETAGGGGALAMGGCGGGGGGKEVVGEGWRRRSPRDSRGWRRRGRSRGGGQGAVCREGVEEAGEVKVLYAASGRHAHTHRPAETCLLLCLAPWEFSHSEKSERRFQWCFLWEEPREGNRELGTVPLGTRTRKHASRRVRDNQAGPSSVRDVLCLPPWGNSIDGYRLGGQAPTSTLQPCVDTVPHRVRAEGYNSFSNRIFNRKCHKLEPFSLCSLTLCDRGRDWKDALLWYRERDT